MTPPLVPPRAVNRSISIKSFSFKAFVIIPRSFDQEHLFSVF